MTQLTREVPYPEIDIREVRNYVNGRANGSSVREIARQTGIGNTSLDKFLNGSEPYARNRGKLCEWYLREHRVHPIPQLIEVPLEVKANDPDGHLDALLQELRGEARSEARVRIIAAVAAGYRRMGLPDPAWLYCDR